MEVCFLSLITHGLYPFYWCFRCWEYLQKKEGIETQPFWRGVFMPLWIYSLLTKINPRWAQGRVVGMSLLFILLSVPMILSESYWLLFMFSFFPLIPLRLWVNQLNADPLVRSVSNFSRFNNLHALVVCLFIYTVEVSVLEKVNMVPSMEIVSGERVPVSHHSFLIDLGIHQLDEEMLYFYSHYNNITYEGSGSFITDQRVAKYEEGHSLASIVETYKTGDVTESYIAESTIDSEIDSIVVKDHESFYETEVTVTRKDRTQFTITIPSDGLNVKAFVTELLSRWKVAALRDSQSQGG